MDLPPNLVRTVTAITSSGTANTVTTGTVVAAPGALTRLRVWGFQCVPNNTVQAVANWRAYCTNLTTGGAVMGASGGTFASPPLAWIPGGVTLGDNVGIGYSVSSALVSMVLNMITYHTVEFT